MPERSQIPFPSVDAFDAQRKTILLVEDEQVLRHLLVRILAGAGYTVLQAEDADSASLQAREHSGRVDLLVSDVVLPDVDGIELFMRLRKTNATLKAVFMSGFGTYVLNRHGILPQGTELIAKPFDRPTLLAALNRLLF